MSEKISLKVTDVRCEARDVMLLELRNPAGKDLPPFEAGSHLEVYLPGNLIRHYSLCNDPTERDRYCIGVGLAKDSRGGSRLIHQSIRVGVTLQTSAPRNNFPFKEEADEFVFIAGGIGITPIMAMIHTCIRLGKKWQLFYCARNRQRMAFYEDLMSLAPERCHLHFDDEQQDFFNPSQALVGISPTAHIYCCGPDPLMKSVEASATGRDPATLHFEWFTATEIDTTGDKPFTVVLRSGKSLEVPAGRSILEELEACGEGVPYSCREGLCATCKTGLLDGIPEHRDNVLSAAERAANKHIIICVSRAMSDTLYLDL
ncbi:oxidoreductase [Pseudomonas taiwanensis]|uniref:PDR/VanB family oxidoreductase n=1 Tax=Pseudomonas TaxID=286 RepID=UPI0015BE4422|nr:MULTISPECIES: PDR/VanB family oxidoreductase [Pseudomonas]MDH4564397.1 oxidoreductase [Pseudomonas sp. BN411]MDH4653759.1 oxidoreductase [Pseudomonas sp. BN606]MDH4874083.1 oxidoreductase [Pseudomonas sp. BN515]NWL75715.1 oxidoreductase [Pseudomonas taiwanensis]